MLGDVPWAFAPMRILFLTAPEIRRRSLDALFPPGASVYLTGMLREAGHQVDPVDLDAAMFADPELTAGLTGHPSVGDSDAWRRQVVEAAPGTAEHDLADRLVASLGSPTHDLVAISARRADGAVLVARAVRERTDAPIVVGGDLDLPPEELLRLGPEIDYVATGYGEDTLPGLLRALQDGAAGRSLPGVLGRRGAGQGTSEPLASGFARRALPDPRGLDPDAYLFLPSRGDHILNPGARLLAPLQFVQGCPFRCSFCRGCGDRAGVHGLQVDPVERVLDALERYTRLSIRDVAFFNNTLCVGRRFVHALADGIAARGLHLRWSDSATFSGLAPDDFARLRASGCVALTFGLESASAPVLERMNRRYDGATAERQLRAAHEAGIWCQVNVIVGFPGETREQFDETAAFVERNADVIDTMAVSTFYLVPSLLTVEPERYGLRLRPDLTGAPSRHNASSLAFDELVGQRMGYAERTDEARRREDELRQRYYRAHGRARPANDVLEVHDLATYCDGAAAARACLEARDLRLLLHTGARCRNACAGCPFTNPRAPHVHRTTHQLEEALRGARRAGYGRVMLTGGEPTLRDDVVGLVRLARELRFREVVVETDGSGLMRTDDAVRLRDAGVAGLALKIEGPDAAAHDAVVGRPGAFAQILEARRLAHAVGLPVTRALPTWLGALSPCMSRRAYAELRQARVRSPWEAGCASCS